MNIEESLLDKIQKKLENLSINENKGKEKVIEKGNPGIKINESSVSVITTNEDIEKNFNIENLEKQFKTEPELEINKLYNRNPGFTGPKVRHYYPRPSYPDVVLEERPQINNARYDGDSINEWNIDGQTEYQIMNTLQEMTMASTAYRSKSTNNTDSKIVRILISGFTGQLKGCWDHYVPQSDKDTIYNAKKQIIKNELVIDPTTGQPGQRTITTQEEDSVAVLIYAITKAFIGEPNEFQNRSSEVLQNLTCPKLHDFRWYKDMFLTKVFSRTDCNYNFWKERFIAGLPKLFAEKVRERIRNSYGNEIPYENLSYGEIINFINNEGLALCNDLKFRAKIKNEYNQSKKELGEFCTQYGYENIRAPSARKAKALKNYMNKPFKKFKNKKVEYHILQYVQ